MLKDGSCAPLLSQSEGHPTCKASIGKSEHDCYTCDILDQMREI